MNLNILKNTPETASSEYDIKKYRQQIDLCYKTNFQTAIAHGNFFDHTNIINKTMHDIGITSWTPEDIRLLTAWHSGMTQLQYLHEYLSDPDITEIITHGNQTIQFQKNGCLYTHEINFDLNETDYQLSLDLLAIRNNLSWNYANPFQSFFTKFTNVMFRATLVHHSLTPNKFSKLFLRRISNHFFPIERFNAPRDINKFLIQAMLDKKNIIISGATSSGKTSLLNTFLNTMNHNNEHIVILEDTHEIQINDNAVTFLLAKPDQQGKTLKDYCSFALRMRPDRIILGELRSDEIIPLILAMNTGHRGVVTTIHANSAYDTFSRLMLLFAVYSNNTNLQNDTILNLLTRNIDYIIYMEKLEIKEIIKPSGHENGRCYFEYIYPVVQAKSFNGFSH